MCAKKESKIIANYLPQYHTVPENDKWWGKGFTDWSTVKKAKPLFENHDQPKKPLNDHYYSLDDADEIRNQAKLAKKYGVYGFGIYHYWFSSKFQLLQTPAELILENLDIDINFLFLWDNSSWKRSWSNVKHANDWAPNFDKNLNRNKTDNQGGMLAELIYGDESDWKKHFMYLLPFFKDDRYIKVDNKPLFGFFQPQNDFKIIEKMTNYWNELAKENGFNGIRCMTRSNYRHQELTYSFRYTPLVPNNLMSYAKYKAIDVLAKKERKIRFYDYDNCWNEILTEAVKANPETYLSGFVNFDDTPRRGEKGRVISGGTPQKFEGYLEKLLRISNQQKKDFVFLTAWNEWGEGAYLEPDEKYKYEYLQAVRDAVHGSRLS